MSSCMYYRFILPSITKRSDETMYEEINPDLLKVNLIKKVETEIACVNEALANILLELDIAIKRVARLEAFIDVNTTIIKQP